MANLGTPLVSIIIPAYNVENTVIETLESVVAQTYDNIEVILIDDGSTDNTSEVIKGFISENVDIQLYSQKNMGLPATRNAGFVRSTGDFVVFLDGDDKIDSLYIEACYGEFLRDPTLDLVYTDTQFFEAKTGAFELPDYSYCQILKGNCIPATAMIRSNSFRDVGMYDTTLRITEDWELWIRYLYKYPNVYKIKKPLFFYRRRFSKDSMTDLNAADHYKTSENARLYIYNKHYAVYCDYGYGIEKVFEESKYKKKYYNVWYRKFFYTFFKKRK